MAASADRFLEGVGPDMTLEAGAVLKRLDAAPDFTSTSHDPKPPHGGNKPYDRDASKPKPRGKSKEKWRPKQTESDEPKPKRKKKKKGAKTSVKSKGKPPKQGSSTTSPPRKN